jgi:hypothetical protein
MTSAALSLAQPAGFARAESARRQAAAMSLHHAGGCLREAFIVENARADVDVF